MWNASLFVLIIFPLVRASERPCPCGPNKPKVCIRPPPPKSRRRDSSQTKPDIKKMKETKKSCLGLYMCAFEKNSDFWPWQPHFWYFLCRKYMFFANNFFQ